ncbi:methyl-accepting chemotaxis protein [Amantichitinum ursilacus]|uniref:Putative methyl-accepting chemotaxis protein YoaH n=1 Tax=Amantichitinum ursilacus TaxID=857265 RepID=A0A0N0GR23_9NEIS|nr:methyl-accepting chemotaxis protein [Amantichitinum ursilacus]KPC55039.1 putative methyl-accepting chemotaxis protein YoaH [Amantichitinum ursilacus]
MSIKSKLVSLVGVTLLLLLVLGINGLYWMRDIQSAFETTYKDRVVCLGQLKNVAEMYTVNVIGTAQKLNARSMSWDRATANLAEARSNIGRNWKAYSATYMPPEEKTLFAEASTNIQAADAAITQLEKLIASKDRVGLDTFARNDIYSTIEPVQQSINKLITLQLKVAKQNFDQSEADYARAEAISIALIAAAILIAAIWSISIVKTLSGKIGRLNTALGHARDHNDLTVRAPVAGKDEVDSIARAYNALADNMQTLVQSVSTAVSTVSREVGQLAETTEQINRAAAAGAESTSSMAAAVEQVTVSIAHVADNASDARQLSEAARQSASSGGEEIVATVANIREIDQAIAEAGRMVGMLGEDTQRVTAIVAVIKDVADQTNLLALNAAIEAARAGEQGRGFAVVADEVRKLAERTALATVDIRNTVEQIGSSSQDVARAMAATVERAHECASTAERAGAAIEAIDRDVNAGGSAIGGIAQALQEHKSGAQLIAQQVERVSQMTDENTAVVGSINEAARRLRDLAGTLQTGVGRFRIA